MTAHDVVSIIIATAAAKERAAELRRALESLRAQSSGRVIAIVVANGRRRDPEVLDYLRRCPDVRLLEREEGSAPKAWRVGRQSVDTRYFGFLDDDDEYLPNAFAVRVAALEADRSVDVLVTSGLRCFRGDDELLLGGIEAYNKNPLASLVDTNWLASCGALFRTDSIGPEILAKMPSYFEWTYLAFLLASQRKVAFIGEPTFRIYVNSAGSLSNTRDYVVNMPTALRTILRLDLPSAIKRHVFRRYVDSLHWAAEEEVRNKNYASAWRFHLSSLTSWYGIRYVPFTRHLLFDTVPGLPGLV